MKTVIIIHGDGRQSGPSPCAFLPNRGDRKQVPVEQYQLLSDNARRCGIAKAEDAKRGLYLLDQVYELMCQIAKK